MLILLVIVLVGLILLKALTPVQALIGFIVGWVLLALLGYARVGF